MLRLVCCMWYAHDCTRPFQRVCWRWFVAQGGVVKNLELHLGMQLLLLLLLLLYYYYYYYYFIIIIIIIIIINAWLVFSRVACVWCLTAVLADKVLNTQLLFSPRKWPAAGTPQMKKVTCKQMKNLSSALTRRKGATQTGRSLRSAGSTDDKLATLCCVCAGVATRHCCHLVSRHVIGIMSLASAGVTSCCGCHLVSHVTDIWCHSLSQTSFGVTCHRHHLVSQRGTDIWCHSLSLMSFGVTCHWHHLVSQHATDIWCQWGSHDRSFEVDSFGRSCFCSTFLIYFLLLPVKSQHGVLVINMSAACVRPQVVWSHKQHVFC